LSTAGLAEGTAPAATAGDGGWRSAARAALRPIVAVKKADVARHQRGQASLRRGRAGGAPQNVIWFIRGLGFESGIAK
jgi:hypothetical protein